jgi:hypothetical protein
MSGISAKADAIVDVTIATPNFAGRVRRQLGLLLHSHSDVTIGREANLIAFDFGHKAAVDVVMVASVQTFTTVGFGQLDPAADDAIDSTDVNSVRTDDFHMLFDAAHVGH